MSDSGWIKLHRDIKKHWIFDSPDHLRAWILILLEANHEDKKVCIGKELIICKRGECLNSLGTWVRILGKGWSMQKIRTFLKLLENDNMIERKGNTKTTKITICNYERYQDCQQTNNKQITNKQQTNNKRITTNKNKQELEELKEVKDIYKKISSKLQMTTNEYKKLTEFYSKQEIDDILDDIENYRGSTKYKSLYKTCLSWLKRNHPNRINQTVTKKPKYNFERPKGSVF